jgi:hypothetical protein
MLSAIPDPPPSFGADDDKVIPRSRPPWRVALASEEGRLND